MRTLLSAVGIFAAVMRTSVAFSSGEIPSTAPVIINEFLTSCRDELGLRDEDLELQEWIEIYNRSSETVDLAGWMLTDDPAHTNKWAFPNRVLGPDEYLIVFASAKNRTNGPHLHTNFKLSSYGEHLALFDPAGNPATRFAPKYPEQRTDISFGLIGTINSHLLRPTPGAPNSDAVVYGGVVAPPHFSAQSGFFQNSFALTLFSETAGSSIRYTLDGSEPSEASRLYTGAVLIATSPNKAAVTLRAAGFSPGYLPSRVVTHTYIFPQQVLAQPASPDGFPSTWKTADGVTVPADYEMDPQVITNGTYNSLARAALTNLPSLSVVLDVNDLFAQGAGIYANPAPPLAERAAWERAAAVELINPDGRGGFSSQAGLRIQGGTSRDPNRTHKHSFRLFFRGDYGDGELKHALFPGSPVKTFKTLILDAGLNLTWTHRTDLSQRPRAQYVRDQFVSDLQDGMGHPSAHGKFVHLYLNGLYWGIYNVHERPDEDFAAAFFGGEPDQYDVVKNTESLEVVSGDNVAWNAMMALANADLENNAQYEQIRQHLDVPAFIDYMIANFYAGNDDWPFHNWYAMRKRDDAGRFRFVSWDAEHTLKDVNYSALGMSQANSPGQLFAFLRNNREFRLLFSDHVHRHFFNAGLLYVNPANSAVDPTRPENNNPAAMYLRRIAEIDPAIVLESARWGDNAPGRENQPYTRNVEWLAELNFLRNTYFPQRSSNVLNHFRTASLYPNAFWVTTPSFNQHGGPVPGGFVLTMATARGTIYYTTNGSDPRVYGTGAISPDAQIYAGPLALESSCMVKARALSGTTWSAVNVASFQVAQVGSPVRITEIMYNPPGGSAYEFIELKNTGGVAVDLSGCSFEGVAFSFPAGSVMPPGVSIVLASSANPTAFSTRYPDVAIAGYFNDALANDGERITLREASGRTVASVAYDDENGWPIAADGGGSSLESINASGDPSDPANWRASVSYGTPGIPAAAGVGSGLRLNELMAENGGAVEHAGTYPDWIELFNSGPAAVDLSGWSCSDDSNPRKFVFPPQTTIAANGYLVVWCDTNSSPGLHTGFSLDREGETVSLHNPAGTRVDVVSFGYQISGRSVGRLDGDWQLALPTPGTTNNAAPVGLTAGLSLNEWLANAAVGANDWLEIYNASDFPGPLGGLFLSTSNNVHCICRLTFVPPRGHLKFIADENSGPQHVNFKLSAGGETLTLSSENAVPLSRVTFGPQTEGLSEGRWPDGGTAILPFPGSSSPGATNYVLNYTGPRLNEVHARNLSIPDGSGRVADWIEMYNPGVLAFPVGGMSLSVGRKMPREWVFPLGTAVPAGGFLAVWCDPQRLPSLIPGPNLNTGLNLADESGGVYLFNTYGQLVDSVEYGQQITRSIGRSADVWQLLNVPTLGAANSIPAPLASPSGLRFNEWMARTTNGSEWFEIYNDANLPVNLAGLFLSDDPSLAGLTKFQIPPLTFVDRTNWVVWLADDDEKSGRNHVNFNLDGEGESLRLYDQDMALLSGVDFGPQQTGFSEGRLPDGGVTSQRFFSGATPRSANRSTLNVLPVILAQPTNTVAIAGYPATFSVAAAGLNLAYQWYFDGQALSGATNSTLFLSRVLPTQAGDFVVVASNPAGSIPSQTANLAITDADSDGDGLSNSWELGCGLNPFDATDANRDLDGDGMSNAAEFLCGTDPTRAASVLRLQMVSHPQTGGKSLRFTAMSNRAYSIQCKNSFGSGWTPLAIIPASEPERAVELEDPQQNAAPQRFYRVICLGIQ